MGFARAASVLESWSIAIGGEDAIARNVASRVWNIATATTDGSGIVLYDDLAPEDVDLTVEIASDALPDDAEPRATITLPSATTSHCASRRRSPRRPPVRSSSASSSRASPATARSLQVMRKLWPFAFSTACVMH